jgi:nucleoporin GLE1
VTGKLAVCYPLGRVVMNLFAAGHPELGEVFMARLVKKCFWVTAWYPRKLPVRYVSLALRIALN